VARRRAITLREKLFARSLLDDRAVLGHRDRVGLAGL
jgi:hypothetical protein